MTESQAKALVATLASFYTHAKVTEDLLEAWASVLVRYPYGPADRACKRLMLASKFFPSSVAEVVAAIVDDFVDLPDVDEAWALLMRAQAAGTPNAFQSLRPEIRAALKAAGGSWALSNEPTWRVRESFASCYRGLRTERQRVAREETLPAIANDARELAAVNVAALPGGRRG